MRAHSIVVTAAAVLLGLASSAPAQAPAAPYDFAGGTIRFLVGNAAGGVTDTEMRLVARHIVNHLPGSPTIVVQNLPGAGGLRMLEFVSQLDSIAEPTLFQLSSSIPFQARAGALGSVFDPRTVNWVGGFLRSTSICVVGTRSGIVTLDDLRTRDATFGALAGTGVTAANFAFLRRGLGLRINPVYGYDTTGNLALAVARGELDGTCAPYSAYPVTFAPLVEAGEIRLLTYLGAERRDDIDVPYAYDLPLVDGQAGFFEAIRAALAFSRPLAMPAGTDPALVAAMRAAFDQMMEDPAYIAEAAALNIDLRYRSPLELEEMTAALYATPEDLVQEIRAFLLE
jgi:tripartite-type tricarboxylate transporter receptor subunit TctC